MKKLILLIVLFVFVSGFTLMAQTILITGTVTSSVQGEGPIPGVTITVKGTTLGVVTDVNGKYSLSVPQASKTITFSYIGMKKQDVDIEGRKVVDVVMSPDILGLNEVVVTALGISREKKALGYSTQQVTSEEISKAGNPNLLTNLSGKLAGVEVRQSSGMPGAPATIFIRGARSFSGNNQPLYVVDGMPISSDADYSQGVTGSYGSARALDIDPNNIESMNVLKGQAAAALYGLRASNGVIVITTKSGKSASKGVPTVSFTSTYTVDKASVLPDVQQTYAQGYYNGNVNNASDLGFFPAFSYSWGPKISDMPNDPVYGGNSQGHANQWFDPYKGDWVAPQAYNNAKAFFKNGTTLYNGINISNSTTFGNYLIGFSNTNQDGIVEGPGMKRYNANGSVNVNLGDKWKGGFSGNYSDVSLKKLPSGNDSWLFTVFGAPASYDLMGTPSHEEGALGTYRQISYRRGAVGENPLWALANNKFLERTRRFFGNTFVEYNPVSWMNVRYQIGIDTYTTDNENVYEAGSAHDGQALPTSSDYPTPANPVFGYRAPTGGNINNYGIMRSVTNSLLNITFNKTIADQIKSVLDYRE